MKQGLKSLSLTYHGINKSGLFSFATDQIFAIRTLRHSIECIKVIHQLKQHVVLRKLLLCQTLSICIRTPVFFGYIYTTQCKCPNQIIWLLLLFRIFCQKKTSTTWINFSFPFIFLAPTFYLFFPPKVFILDLVDFYSP